MTEETKEIKIDEETKQQLGNASISRINQIAKMAKEYYRAINGSINSTELYMIGVDTILAGWSLISRSNDMDQLDVDGRIAMAKATMDTVQKVIDKVYLNPEVVAGMVAKAAVESANRDSKLKSFKGTK